MAEKIKQEINIDANEIGRHGYNLLRTSKIIPDVDKKDLTLKERENLLIEIGNLQENLLVNSDKKSENYNKDKCNFLMFLYSAIICYIDNTDLNKYLKITPKD